MNVIEKAVVNISAAFLLSVLGAAPLHAATYFYHTDHLGTPQALTDDNQQVVWQGEQDPFGENTPSVVSIEQNLRFPGQYFDAESGLHYNYFRDYDPALGRYVQSDPIGLLKDYEKLGTVVNTLLSLSTADESLFTTLNQAFVYVDVNPITQADYYGLTGGITGFRLHGMHQQMNRGVKSSSMLDAVRNPISVIDKPNGTRLYTGASAAVALNVCGQVVTVWGK